MATQKKGRTSTSPGKKPERTPAQAVLSHLRKEPNDLRKKMLLLGFLSDELSRKAGLLFLVGGQAVETYTAGQFTTGDVDVTTTDRKATESLLGRLGFKKEGMVWLSEKLGIAVHIVGSYPSRTARIRSVEVGPYTVRVVGVEELIIDRLKAAKFWKSGRDSEQAVVLFNGFRDRIDIDYLRARAREEKVDDILPQVGKTKGWYGSLKGVGKFSKEDELDQHD
jgi:hypothetical protein